MIPCCLSKSLLAASTDVSSRRIRSAKSPFAAKTPIPAFMIIRHDHPLRLHISHWEKVMQVWIGTGTSSFSGAGLLICGTSENLLKCSKSGNTNKQWLVSRRRLLGSRSSKYTSIFEYHRMIPIAIDDIDFLSHEETLGHKFLYTKKMNTSSTNVSTFALSKMQRFSSESSSYIAQVQGLLQPTFRAPLHFCVSGIFPTDPELFVTS